MSLTQPSHPKKDRTLVLIKPDGVQRSLMGEIISRFERVGLKLVAMKFVVASEEQYWAHYNKEDEWFLKKGTGTVENRKKLGLSVEKEAIKSMNEETLRTELLHQGVYDEVTVQKVVYSDADVLSVTEFFDSSCGGAHPSHGTSGYNFDLKTGEEIEWENLFTDHVNNYKTIVTLVFAEKKYNWKTSRFR